MKVRTKQNPEIWVDVHSAHGSGENRIYDLSDGRSVKREDVIEFRYDEELGDVKLKLDKD